MTSRPSLLILSFSPIARDPRVLKQVRLFAPRYDVTTCGYGPAPDGVGRHVEIPAHIQHWRHNGRYLLLRQYSRAYWANEAVSFAREHLLAGRFDGVLADDVETVPLALALRPRRGVHADLHEYSPRQNEELRPWRQVVAPYIRWICRRHVTRASSVTTVGRGIANEYRRVFGIDAKVVTNAAPFADLEPRSVGSPIRLVHSGNAMRNRRLHLLVEAAAAHPESVILDMYLMPNDPANLEELQTAAANTANVRVLDPVPYADLVPTLNSYDIGIHLLAPTNFNNRWALPNKFFEYVQARLGVIVGPSPEMAGTVQSRGFGTVAEDFTAEALSDVLGELDEQRVARWKAASHAAARDLSAESQMLVWAEAIESLIGPGSHA